MIEVSVAVLLSSNMDESILHYLPPIAPLRHGDPPAIHSKKQLPSHTLLSSYGNCDRVASSRRYSLLNSCPVCSKLARGLPYDHRDSLHFYLADCGSLLEAVCASCAEVYYATSNEHLVDERNIE